MTMPKRAGELNRSDTELTQKTIAYAYAIGGNVMVPWDIYMPGALLRGADFEPSGIRWANGIPLHCYCVCRFAV